MSTPLTTPTFDARDFWGTDNSSDLPTIRRYDRRDHAPVVIVWLAWSASCTICFLVGGLLGYVVGK